MPMFGIYFEDNDAQAVARDSNPDLFFLPDHGIVEHWAGRDLTLSEGVITDYLASDMGCRMCSEKMRGVLDESRSENDHLQWLPVVVHAGKESLTYYILHLPTPLPILDKDRTLYAAGGRAVVKPVIDPKAAEGHAVMAYPGAGQLGLVVNEATMKALKRAGCTGMSFSRMSGT